MLQSRESKKLPVGSRVRTKLRRGIFEKASKPGYSKEVYKVQAHQGNRHILVDAKGNPIENQPVISDVRQVTANTALFEPKQRSTERTFDASSISMPYTKELRRSKRGKDRVDYSRFL